MIKVKLIHNTYVSARNGANTVIRSLLDSKEQFACQGIDISSLSPDTLCERSFEANSKDAEANARRKRIKMWVKELSQHFSPAAALVVYLSDLRPAKKIISYYLSNNPDDDVVFFHSLTTCYYYLKLRKKRQKTVVVCHTNGDNFKMSRTYYPTLEKSFLYRKLLRMEQFVIKHADRINFVADTARHTFLELHPNADPRKVSFIYNGIPDNLALKRTISVDKIMEFCCVASISNRKGQHYIVDALKEIPNISLPKVHFTFVGDGADRERLEKEVKEFGLSDYVTFIGVSFEVDDYLVNSDAFILPSEDEGLPMAIIEAMRASLPVISTPVGGIPEMIKHGRNGLLIKPCTESVKELLLHIGDYKWKEMGENARKTFEEKFSIEMMVEAYGKLLCNC